MTQEQEKMDATPEFETQEEVKTLTSKNTNWKDSKENFVDQIIQFGENIRGNITDTQLRSVFSAAFVKYNLKIKSQKQ